MANSVLTKGAIRKDIIKRMGGVNEGKLKECEEERVV